MGLAPARVGTYRLRAAEHLPRVREGCPGYFDASQHSGDLLYPFVPVQTIDRGSCPSPFDMFRYSEMMIAKFGDLRQMGDTNDLVVPG